MDAGLGFIWRISVQSTMREFRAYVKYLTLPTEASRIDFRRGNHRRYYVLVCHAISGDEPSRVPRVADLHCESAKLKKSRANGRYR
jgi:hypothetical protein